MNIRRTAKLVILAALLGLVLAPASGALAQIRTTPIGSLGPIATYPTFVDPIGGLQKPGNGYPLYVQDMNGLRIDLPTPVALPLIFDAPTTDPFSQAIGFGTEAFYYLCESTMDVGGNPAKLTLGVEAAFGGGDALNGDQFLFVRERVRFDPPHLGDYTVTHPWGSRVLSAVESTPGSGVPDRIFFTFDWGGFGQTSLDNPANALDLLGNPTGFNRMLISPTPWVFMRTLNNTLDPTAWVGDFIANPLEPTTGPNGPVATSFTITGPDATGANQTWTTPLFSVVGHIYGSAAPLPPPPGATDQVTITRSRLRTNAVEVRATSSNGFSMTGELLAGGVVVGSANLGTSGRGNISYTSTPDTVRVHSTSTNPAIAAGVATAPVAP